jgi:hypothetical protein
MKSSCVVVGALALILPLWADDKDHSSPDPIAGH